MPRTARHLPLLLAFLLWFSPGADAQATSIEWCKDLTTGMAKAKETGRILMVCVNAKHVEGRTEEEPAAKGLREVVYKDRRIVAKAAEFVCVMLTPTSSTADYGELGSLGMEGKFISPQHIFVNAAGTKILLRREYWSYGKGEGAIEALLRLMEKAQKRAAGEGDAPEGGAKVDGPPGDGQERAEWIAATLGLIGGAPGEREGAIQALIKADKDGDCTTPLIALLPENKKKVEILKSLIRALGRDGLTEAALPIAAFLGHRDLCIRGCAAVSLEYIGSQEKKVVAALMKAAGKQKDAAIANHICRALGRCGAKDAKARQLLLKMAASGRSEFATYGPSIGLAYFEGDTKAMRGVEKILKQMGVPGGGRGGGGNTVKRGVVSWTLASIGDAKSGKFVRAELLGPLSKVKAFWVEGMRNFWNGVAQACEGDASALSGVTSGVLVFVGVAKRFGMGGADMKYSLQDDCRTGRASSTFTPKGEKLLGATEED